VKPTLPPELCVVVERARPSPPLQQVGNVLPGGECRPHALAGQRIRELGPDTGKTAVASGEKRRRRRQGGYLRHQPAQRVVYDQQPVGSGNPEMDMHAGGQPCAARRPPVPLLDGDIPGPWRDRRQQVADGVCGEADEPCLSVQRLDHEPATLNEIRHGLVGTKMYSRHDLDLRRRELGMEPVIVSEEDQELSGDRAQRMGPVDQQQLLLDSDGERLSSIE
jgi:hypothetical protein